MDNNVCHGIYKYIELIGFPYVYANRIQLVAVYVKVSNNVH